MTQSKSLLFCIVVIIASSLCIGKLQAQSNVRMFTDVPSTHWAKDAIDYVTRKGIMNGRNANEFSPDAPMTRADFAMFIYTFSGARTNDLVESSYTTNSPKKDKNNQRRSDVNTILNAVYQYAIDNNGIFPFTYSGNKPIHICRTDIVCPKNMVDLSRLTGSYIAVVPVDPESKSKLSTDYTISIDKSNRVTVNAPLAKENISVTR
jgi:hypothetical protein